MKQKRQVAVLGVLIVIAALTWWLYFRGDRPVVTAAINIAAQKVEGIDVESPGLHMDAIARARKTEYKSAGRNIFSVVAAAPVATRPQAPRVPSIPNIGPKPPVPEPPKQVPPLPVKFFGFGTVPNGRTRLAFFTNGEDVFVVPEGELLMNRFRILKIGNANLDYEEVSSGLRGTAPLEEQAQGAPGPSA